LKNRKGGWGGTNNHEKKTFEKGKSQRKRLGFPFQEKVEGQRQGGDKKGGSEFHLGNGGGNEFEHLKKGDKTKKGLVFRRKRGGGGRGRK